MTGYQDWKAYDNLELLGAGLKKNHDLKTTGKTFGFLKFKSDYLGQMSVENDINKKAATIIRNQVAGNISTGDAGYIKTGIYERIDKQEVRKRCKLRKAQSSTFHSRRNKLHHSKCP